MAKTQTPYGLRPAKMLGESYNTSGFNEYPIASGYAANILFGDLVVLAVGGTVQKYTGTTTAPANGILGVFLGCSYTDATQGFLNRQIWPTGQVASNAMAYVLDDPAAVFQVQANGSLNQNAVGTNAAVVQGAGNTTLAISGVSLNAASIAATATLPLRVVGLVNNVGQSTPGDAFTDVLVRINLHTHATTTGNAGV